MKQIVVHPGQKVIGKDGRTHIVALVLHGKVYVHSRDGWLVAIEVCGDAWGGEHDQEIGLAA